MVRCGCRSARPLRWGGHILQSAARYRWQKTRGSIDLDDECSVLFLS